MGGAGRGRGWMLGCTAAIVMACGCGDDTVTGGGGSGGTPAAGGEGGGGAPQGSTTTTAMGGGGSSASPDIGKACVEDGDCAGATAVCLKPSDSLPNIPPNTGGPAGGYCSQPCADNDECGADGVCDLVGDEGVCFLSCEKGTGDEHDADLDPDKCWGREDVACTSVNTAEGVADVCLPTCGEDIQCPGGRVCDPRFRWCVETPTDGQANETSCVPKGAEECAGVCLGVNATQGMCSVRCVYGGDQVATNDCGGVEAGLCAATDSAAGDESICLPACSNQAACFANHLVCQHVPQGGLYAYCLPPLACPGGQPDCAQIAGTTCGAGPDGTNVCLDDTVPLE